MSRLVQLTGPVVDLLYRVREMPASGEEAVVTGFASEIGGGYNAMVAARRAGIAAAFGGRLGTGPFAAMIRAAMEEQGMQFLAASLPDHDQGSCVVLIEPSGERSFVAWPAAEGIMSAGQLDGLHLAPDDWVMFSGYTLLYPESGGELARWLSSGRALPPVVFDPTPLVAEIPAERLTPVMDCAAWISANAREAEVLTGEPDPERAALTLAAPRAGALVRLGAGGCLLASGGRCHLVPAPQVAPVDTNGAGDTHIGSFIAELALTGDALRAARYASVAAALSITRTGPATAPERAAVEAALAHLPG